MSTLWAWLLAGEHWTGSDGILTRIVEHLVFSVITVAIAAAIAIPLGLWIGHTGKGRVVAVNVVNGVRSLPTLGLLFIAVLVLGPRLRGDLAFVLPRSSCSSSSPCRRSSPAPIRGWMRSTRPRATRPRAWG